MVTTPWVETAVTRPWVETHVYRCAVATRLTRRLWDVFGTARASRRDAAMVGRGFNP